MKAGSRTRRPVRVLAFWCCLAAAAWGQVVGNDPSPLKPGQFRLQYAFYGTLGERAYNNQGQLVPKLGQHSDLHQFRLGAGLAPNLDLFVQGGEGLVRSEDDNRFSHPVAAAGDDDVLIGLRWRFLNEEDLQVSWLIQPSFSAGPIEVEAGELLGVGLGYNALNQAVVVRKDFDSFQLWAEGFYSFPLDNKPGGLRTLGANLALGYQVNDAVTPTLELTYVASQPGNIRYLGLTPGLNWSISEQWSLSAGVQFTLTGQNVDQVIRPMFILSFVP